MKGEERVCHVTEADAPGANALDVSEEVSSCEAAWRRGFCPCARRFCAAFPRRNFGSAATETPGIKRK